MKTNKHGIDLIKKYEGIGLSPYLDYAGIPTIGYGATYYENGDKVSMNDAPISIARAEDLLLNHIREIEKAVSNLVKTDINENQFSAIVSFAYNCGITNLRRSTLLKSVNTGDMTKAADEFMKWVFSKGEKLKGLVERRKAERELFLRQHDFSCKN